MSFVTLLRHFLVIIRRYNVIKKESPLTVKALKHRRCQGDLLRHHPGCPYLSIYGPRADGRRMTES